MDGGRRSPKMTWVMRQTGSGGGGERGGDGGEILRIEKEVTDVLKKKVFGTIAVDIRKHEQSCETCTCEKLGGGAGIQAVLHTCN